MKRIPFTQFRDRVLLYRLLATSGDGMGGLQPGVRRAIFFDGTRLASRIHTRDGDGQLAITEQLKYMDAQSLTPCQVHAPHFWDGAVEGRAGGSITMGITVRLTPNLEQWLYGDWVIATRLVYHGETYKVLDADYSRRGYVTFTAVKVKLHGI